MEPYQPTCGERLWKCPRPLLIEHSEAPVQGFLSLSPLLTQQKVERTGRIYLISSVTPFLVCTTMASVLLCDTTPTSPNIVGLTMPFVLLEVEMLQNIISIEPPSHLLPGLEAKPSLKIAVRMTREAGLGACDICAAVLFTALSLLISIFRLVPQACQVAGILGYPKAR